MTSLDGAGGFFPRVCLCETRLMRPTSPAPSRAIGRCETTHRRAADDDALQDLCLRDMNSVAAVGKRERSALPLCLEVSCRWRNGWLARCLRADQPVLQVGKGGCGAGSETLSVGRRVPLPANPARSTRKCRSQRGSSDVSKVCEYCAHIIGSPTSCCCGSMQSESAWRERREDKMTASANICKFDAASRKRDEGRGNSTPRPKPRKLGIA